jgi:hypothetical protein
MKYNPESAGRNVKAMWSIVMEIIAKSLSVLAVIFNSAPPYISLIFGNKKTAAQRF